MDGFRQDGGKFAIGSGGATLDAGAGVIIDFEGGVINFPSGTDYETLNVGKKLLIHNTTVNMKINGQSDAAGNFDRFLVAGDIDINSASVLNISVNNTVAAGKSWVLFSAFHANITGGFGLITPINTFTWSIVTDAFGNSDFELKS